MNIKEIKSNEIQEIRDFCDGYLKGRLTEMKDILGELDIN